MIKKEEVSIQQVSNGFVVMPRANTHQMIGNNDIYVFQSMTELKIWLENHFTIIDKRILSDV